MKVISLSLWGADERYTLGALANARLASVIYPGWTVRVYCALDVPVIDDLRTLGADVRLMPVPVRQAGLFWRFLPLGDPECTHVIVRDADSRLNAREKSAVDAWMASGLPFHVMRDHVFHRHMPVPGGMWGGVGGAIADIGDRVAPFASGCAKGADQAFLAQQVWPVIKGRCLVHTSVPEPLGGDPFPAHAPFDGFVGEIVDPRAELRDVVALLLPSHGRPGAAVAAVQRARRTAADPDRLRIVVGVESEEADAYCRAFGDDAACIRILESGGSYVRAVRELHRTTAAGIYGLVADDFSFDTAGWDQRIRRTVAGLPERLGLVYGEDGIQGESLATAPFLTAEWIECVGDILPGGYEHMGCDTEITDIAKQAGVARFLPDVRITHRHPLAGLAVPDATYARGLATMAAGREEFARRTAERARLAARLMEASHAPLLSVLVHGTVDAGGRLDALVARVRHDVVAHAGAEAVEILVEADLGERPARDKRRRLLEAARGRWVMFIDGGDEVADAGMMRILRALDDAADAVVADDFVGTDEGQSEGPRRAIAVRRTIALLAAKRGAIAREAAGWSIAIAALAKRATVVDGDVCHPRLEHPGSTPRLHVARTVYTHDVPDAFGEAADAWLPTRAERQLLTAALAVGDAARDAWSAWASAVGVERADDRSAAIFPLAWRNLERVAVTGADVNALKPYYWSSWAAARTSVALVAEVARVFADVGLSAVLATDVALSVRHYERPDLRPMNEVAFALRMSAVDVASVVLRSAGWREAARHDGRGAPLGARHFKDSAGRRLALCAWADDDRRWDRTETIDVGGHPAIVPASDDMLVDVLSRATRDGATKGIVWLADVVAIVRSCGASLNWGRFTQDVRSCGGADQVCRALEYVRTVVDLPALDEVTRRLKRSGEEARGFPAPAEVDA